MTKVLGVDICRSSIVCCLLNDAPIDARESFIDTEFYTFQANAAGLKAAIALAPDVAVMEPTGVNYQRLWGTKLAEAGVEVRLVSNNALPAYRKSLDLPDKDDEADALALACYYYAFANSPRRWLQQRDQELARMRDLCLRLAHINRVQSPIVNRIRQDLAWQFPEIANRQAKRDLFKPAPNLWRWVAGRSNSKKYDREYAATVGSGIEQETRFAAAMLSDLGEQESLLEMELAAIVRTSERFSVYREIFDKFGFGLRISGMILSQIYPFENFLNDEGQPLIAVRKGRNSGKPTRRYLSERRFKKSLGVAPTREWSGQDNRTMQKAGSGLCRTALWQWTFTRIEVARCRPKNEIGIELGRIMDGYKAAKMPARKLRMKVAAKAVEMLFAELCEAYNNHR
jgi:transposase